MERGLQGMVREQAEVVEPVSDEIKIKLVDGESILTFFIDLKIRSICHFNRL
jgi:hypothetical protein